MLIVKAENLRKTYQLGSSSIEVLKDVNLEVEATDFAAIIGPSGSGKTTLLNMVGLIDYPTSGKIIFKEKDTSLLSLNERRRLRFQNIGFVFQTFNLLPTLTALENVELPLAFIGLPQKAQREKATQLLETMELETRLHHKPRELSMGEMQRVAIARALVNDPFLIIADEPTGELDSNTGSEIIEILISLCREKKTAILVASHDKKIVDVANKKYQILDGSVAELTEKSD
ncbi:MAG: ABC transporter ATP-binding protein [Candidatus Bathyarchaeota archaeon]